MKDTAIPASPWGAIHHQRTIADGILEVSTQRHGGVLLSKQRNQEIPEYMRFSDGAYEEDSDVAIPMLIFAEEFARKHNESAEKIKECALAMIRCWHPDAYEKYTGKTLKEGESYARDRKRFDERKANSLVVTYATTIGNGMMRCTATLGGRRGNEADEQYFIVSQDEYRNSPWYGFFIDPKRHEEVPHPAGEKAK